MSEIESFQKVVKALQKEYHKQYYIDNKAHLQERRRIHGETHKEVIAARSKKYYVENIESVKEWQRTKVQCSCGGRYTLTNKAQHQKTDLHIKSLVVELG